MWLSRAWAEVVAHPDREQCRRHRLAGTALDYAEGLRATDPRRVAAYFTKHGLMAAKEYQHEVPPEVVYEPGNGPGRLWGVWGLERAVRTVAVPREDGVQAGCIARRWAKAQRRAPQTWKRRVEQATGRVRYRKSRSAPTRGAVGDSSAWRPDPDRSAEVDATGARSGAVSRSA